MVIVTLGAFAVVAWAGWLFFRPAPWACPACDGTGKKEPANEKMSLRVEHADNELQDVLFARQGICLACRGKGKVRV